MTMTQVALSLSGIVLASMLIHACQAEVIQDNRGAVSGTAQSQRAEESKSDETNADTEDQKVEVESAQDTKQPEPKAETPPSSTKYTMSWDVSADPAVVAYKVFVVPPDRNPRFPGKTDIPVQVKNFPLAALQSNGQKYSIAVTSDEVKTALGSTVVNGAAYCFTVVAVNGVGNSAHSPLICP